MTLRYVPDSWITALYRFVVQHGVGRFTNVKIEDRVILTINTTKPKGGHYCVEMSLSNGNRRRVVFGDRGNVVKDENIP